MLFGGNLLRQPAFVDLVSDNPNSIRCVSQLEGADQIMNTTLFLGTYPGLTTKMLDFEIDVITSFVRRYG